VRSIADIRVGTALVAATAVRDGSMWCTNTFDAETKQALIRASERVVLIADSSKFESTAVMRVSGLDAVDILVTDDQLDPQIARRIERSGVDVITVPTATVTATDHPERSPDHQPVVATGRRGAVD
jgi:DeoR family fructose operon transcriptional repressor